MPITRCPYCHAITDEADKYCNNCGTQLLFPEDETLEEEIPGEKIVDAELEEKDYEIDEPEEEMKELFDELDEKETDTSAEDEKIRTEELIEEIGEDLEEEVELETHESVEDTGDIGEDVSEGEDKKDVSGREEFEEGVRAETAPPTDVPEAAADDELTPEMSVPPRDESEVLKPQIREEEETWTYPVRPIPEEEQEAETGAHPEDVTPAQEEQEIPEVAIGEEEKKELYGERQGVETGIFEPEEEPLVGEPAALGESGVEEIETVEDVEVEPEPPVLEEAESPTEDETGAYPKGIAPAEERAETSGEEVEEERNLYQEWQRVEAAAAETEEEPLAGEDVALEETGREEVETEEKDVEPGQVNLEEAEAPAQENVGVYLEGAAPAEELKDTPGEEIGEETEGPDREPEDEEEFPEDRQAAEAAVDETEEELLVGEPVAFEESGTKEIETVEEPGVEAADVETEEEEVLEEPPAVTGEESPDAQTFDTWELDRMGKTVELGQEKVDKFIEIMAEKEKEEEAGEEEREEERQTKERRSDTGGTLPPWADEMRGAPSFNVQKEVFPPLEGEEEREPAGDAVQIGEKEGAPVETEETGILPRRRPSDSGIGFPERLTQPALPFRQEAEEEKRVEEEEREEELELDETDRVMPAAPPRGREEFLRSQEGEKEELEFEEEEERSDTVRPAFNLSVFLKAKAFDCLFLALLWILANWFAARSLGTTLFGLLSSAGGVLLVLYLTFVVMYFFLFQFFLGETLGDRLFRKKG